jgi:ATP-dependent DNA helicase DinG
VEQLKKCSLYLQEIAERDDNFQLLSERLSHYQLFLSDLAGSQQNLVNAIYWLELFKSSLVINRTPLSVAASFQSVLLPKSAYIYTSATLATSLGFQHFTEQLGLQQIKTNIFDSPFDYGQQTLLYLPRGMPDPNADDYIEQLTEKALPLIQAYQGRTFYLFTSFRALHKAEEILRQHTELSLFVQGEMGKSELVQAFINSHQGVLLGTSSFWEGVDVKGDALSCVIIDKLPFESPFDPVVEARLRQLKQQGLDPFNYHQLPLAIIALKQGLGRLIRSQFDKGVLMIGDPRLSARKYGEAFIESLPAMPISRDLQVVLEFVKSCE